MHSQTEAGTCVAPLSPPADSTSAGSAACPSSTKIAQQASVKHMRQRLLSAKASAALQPPGVTTRLLLLLLLLATALYDRLPLSPDTSVA